MGTVPRSAATGGEGDRRDPDPPQPSESSLQGAASATPRIPGWAAARDVRPNAGELAISRRILLHIAGQPRWEPGGRVAVRSLTQEGIAEALGTSQGAASNALRRLTLGGALTVERRHVPGKGRRVKVYGLTPRGEQLVVRFLQRPVDGPSTASAR
jgi:hypothetical protein